MIIFCRILLCTTSLHYTIVFWSKNYNQKVSLFFQNDTFFVMKRERFWRGWMSILLHKILFITQKSHGFAAALFPFIGYVLRTLSDDIRSPLAYAYAELNAHGARHARPLSFARMGVLRTSQDKQIELSLCSIFSLRSKQKSHGFRHGSSSLFVEIFLIHFFCC